MSSKIKNIGLLAIILFLTACASSVRFASERTSIKEDISETKEQNKDYKGSRNIKQLPQNDDKLNSAQQKIVATAQSWLGTPYLWGGNTRNGVDCSGFVKNVFDEVGIVLPRTAQMQYNYSKRIDWDDLRPGDLLFYRKNGKISHVALYIGKGEIIHSATGRGVVKQTINDDYLTSIYAGAGRVLN